MKREFRFIFALLFLTCLPVNTVNAAGVFSFTGGTVGSGPLVDQVTIGYGFNVSSDVSVTEIGWFDFGDDGLVADHSVAIWNLGSMTQVLSAVISASTGTLDSGFRYQPLLIPQTLLAGDYVIGGTAASVADSYVGIATASGSLGLSYLDPRVNFTGPLAFPTVQFVSDADGYFGPNLKVEPVSAPAVPIPPAAWLFGSGLLGLAGIARMKKATK